MTVTRSGAPAGEHPYPYAPPRPQFTPLAAGPLPARAPGATLGSLVVPDVRRSVADRRVLDRPLLERVIGGLRRIPRPDEDNGIFAAVAAEHYQAGPAAAGPGTAPGPVPGWPEGVARGLLIAGLWDAARWYSDMDGAACPDCDAEDGLCLLHARAHAKATEYEALHDFAAQAASDAEALARVLAQVPGADLGDLRSPGSPLDQLFAAALGTERSAG